MNLPIVAQSAQSPTASQALFPKFPVFLLTLSINVGLSSRTEAQDLSGFGAPGSERVECPSYPSSEVGPGCGAWQPAAAAVGDLLR